MLTQASFALLSSLLSRSELVGFVEVCASPCLFLKGINWHHIIPTCETNNTPLKVFYLLLKLMSMTKLASYHVPVNSEISICRLQSSAILWKHKRTQ